MPLKPGQRLPSEAQLAAQYSVSVPTVREALRSLYQMGLVDRRQGSGTYRSEAPKVPASKGKDVSSKYVAIICPLDLTNGTVSCYFIQLALHTGKCLKAMGLRPQLYYGETAPTDPWTFDDTLLRKDIDAGLINGAVIICDSTDAAYKRLLLEKGIPSVETSVSCSSRGVPMMQDFMDLAVSYLISRKRRKLACIGFGHPVNNGSPDFRKFVEKHHAITDESWILGDLHPNQSGAGYSLMRELWSRGSVKPDGLVLCDDVFFPDTALAVAELGISIPDNLMIVSHTNPGVRLVAPFPVVRLELNSLEFARQIAERIHAHITGGAIDAKANFTVDHVLIDPFADEAAESGAQQHRPSRVKV